MQRAYDNAMKQYGTGSDLQKAAQAVSGALTALAGNNLAGALASGASPYLATEIKKLTTTDGQVNVAANAMAHAVLGAVTTQLNNQSAVAGGLGAGGGELAARYIAGRLFPGKTAEQLSESEKQQLSALSELAAGLAGGLATGDTGGAVTAAQAGKNAVENNALSLPSGMMNYGQAAASWNQYAMDNNLTPEQTQTGLDKLAKGDLPEGANITKAIVEGYQDGVFMAGAFYLGPTVAIGKGITGAVIGGGANSAFQYINMAPGGEFSYYSAAVAAGAGYLAPGYKIGGNTLINMGGAFMTDGPYLSSQGGAVAGSLAAGTFGKYAPGLVDKFGTELPSFAYDILGGMGFEYINDSTKDALKPARGNQK